jgi:hypothetical protein
MPAFGGILASPFRLNRCLAAKNAALRQQLHASCFACDFKFGRNFPLASTNVGSQEITNVARSGIPWSFFWVEQWTLAIWMRWFCTFATFATLAELLSDPITHAVMQADHVSPQELEPLLRDLAQRRADSFARARPDGGSE